MDNRLQAELDPSGASVRLRVLELDWIGKQAEITVLRTVKVKRSSGVNYSETVAHFEVRLNALQDLRLEQAVTGFHYDGASIALGWVLRFKIDDGILFDSKVELPLVLPQLPRDSAGDDPARIVDPVDRYSLLANFRALAPSDRLKAMAMSVVCGVLLLINMAVGWHDERVPESQVLFYDHTGTEDGKRTQESPLMKAAGGSVAIGGGAFIYLIALLRRYMRFELKQKKLPGRDSRIALAELVTGLARVPLEGAEIRIVVANVERGQVRVKRNKTTKIESFKQVVRAVVLHKQALPRIPANVPIERYLTDVVDFSQLYRALYPPLMIGSAHGIDLVWEVQLIHPLYVDQEAAGTVGELNPDDFLG